MTLGTNGGRHGHSAIDALEQARTAAETGAVHHVLVIDLSPVLNMVKLFGRDEDGQVVFYTEASKADADRILAEFGDNRDVTTTAQALTDSGMSQQDAWVAAPRISSP